MAGWKTVIINILMLIVMIATQRGLDIPPELSSEENITTGVNAIWVVYGFGAAVVNLILRFFTKSPVFKKE